MDRPNVWGSDRVPQESHGLKPYTVYTLLTRKGTIQNRAFLSPPN